MVSYNHPSVRSCVPDHWEGLQLNIYKYFVEQSCKEIIKTYYIIPQFHRLIISLYTKRLYMAVIGVVPLEEKQ